MTEEWRAISDHEGVYEVSSHGRVRRLVQRYYRCVRPLAQPIIVTPKRVGKGYLAVALAKDGKKRSRYIQNLVLEAFVGPRPGPNYDGAHDDGIRHNNRLSNLAWKTRAENHMDKHRHGTMPTGSRHWTARRRAAGANP